MTIPRSYLYVPGDRPDRLRNAFSRGADAVIADLEDAVAPDAKTQARENVVRWLESLTGPTAPIWVRVNSGDRRDEDLRAVASHPAVTGILLPKVDHADEIAQANALIEGAGARVLWAPMIESAVGLTRIHEIASAPRVHQLHIGEMDLAADLGLEPGDDEQGLLYARSLTVVASRAAGLLPPAAPVSSEIEDAVAFRVTTDRLRALGFVGRDCIHPAQVAIANTAFSPSETDVVWAQDVLDAAAVSPGAFRDGSGAMVDEAVLRRARLILERADRSSR